jgi:hypothetical protein
MLLLAYEFRGRGPQKQVFQRDFGGRRAIRGT